MNMSMNKTLDEAFDSKVLVADCPYHVGLTRVVDAVVRGANIPMAALLNDSRMYAKTAELDYVLNYPSLVDDNLYGLAFTSMSSTEVYKRMIGLSGMLIRNKKRVQLRTLHELSDMIKSEEPIDKDCLFVPDFSIPDNGEVSDWLKQRLYSILLMRVSKGLQTFLYVRDFKSLRVQFGDVFAEHIQQNFCIIET